MLQCIVEILFSRIVEILFFCCSVWQYVAVYCSVLQCVAARCKTEHPAPRDSNPLFLLHCVAVCCRALQLVAARRKTEHPATRRSNLPFQIYL